MPKTKRHTWTKEEDRIIQDGLKSGLTVKDLKEKLPSMTDSSIRSRIQKLKAEPSQPLHKANSK